jgi:lysophospholipase L1-like esterase
MIRSSRNTNRSSWKPYQKKRRLSRVWLILLAVPLTLVALELLMRLGVGIAGKTAELSAYEGEAQSTTAYRLKYLDRAGKVYDGLPDRGRLKVERSSLMGYKLLPNQETPYWRINAQGIRSDQPIDPTKPKDEVRVVVLGGSTAFGQLSSTNQTTFASRLETRFNQQVASQKKDPGKFRPDVLPYFADELAKAMALPARIRESKYRVINAAVPGYASSNELAQFALQVSDYKPDFIVVLDGYADLLLPSKQEGVDVPNIEAFLENSSHHLTTSLSQQFKRLVYQSFLIRGFQNWVSRPQDATNFMIPPDVDASLPQRVSTSDAELNQRVSRYRNNLQQMVRLATAAKIPIVVALQPEITSRTPSKLTAPEKKILSQLGSDYPQRIKAGYAQLQKSTEQVKQEFPKGMTALNLYDFYANAPGQTFHDPIHLTDEANTKLADRLYEAIAPLLLMEPKPNESTEAPTT